MDDMRKGLGEDLRHRYYQGMCVVGAVTPDALQELRERWSDQTGITVTCDQTPEGYDRCYMEEHGYVTAQAIAVPSEVGNAMRAERGKVPLAAPVKTKGKTYRLKNPKRSS